MKRFFRRAGVAGLLTQALLIVMMLFGAPAFATAASNSTALDISKLSPEMQQQLRQQVEQAKSEAQSPSKQAQEAVSEWAGIGKAIGEGLVTTARELGVAANEFAKSDVGRLTVAIIVWKYLGHDVLGIVVGLITLLITFPLGLYFLRRSSLEVPHVEYVYTPVLWGLFSRRRVGKIVRSRRDRLSNSETFMQVAGYICFAVGFIGSMVCFF